MRIGVRRLRACLSLARRTIATERIEPLRVELRWLAQALGPARDLDVFVTSTLPDFREAVARGSGAALSPALAKLAARTTARRRRGARAGARGGRLAALRAARALRGRARRIARARRRIARRARRPFRARSRTALAQTAAPGARGARHRISRTPRPRRVMPRAWPPRSFATPPSSSRRCMPASGRARIASRWPRCRKSSAHGTTPRSRRASPRRSRGRSRPPPRRSKAGPRRAARAAARRWPRSGRAS